MSVRPHRSFSPLQVALIESTISAIAAKPKKLNMDSWFGNRSGCGSTACIAGHMIVQAGYPFKDGGDDAIHPTDLTPSSIGQLMGSAGDIAAQLLGGTNDKGEFDHLFLVESWPQKFQKQYYNATTYEQTAEAVTERLRYFLQRRK